jgi:mannose-6-phosphate isomerase-like protein (cupin superfamily)
MTAKRSRLRASVQGHPEEVHPWGSIVWLKSGTLDPGATMTVGLCRIKAGDGNRAHYHPNCDEILYVISGRCRKQIGDQSFDLGPGECVRIPKGEVHQATCTSDEPMTCLIVYDTPARQIIFV